MTKRILGVLLSGVLITVMAAPAFATSLQDAKKEKSGIESNIKEVEQQIKDMKVTKGNLEDYICLLYTSSQFYPPISLLRTGRESWHFSGAIPPRPSRRKWT